MSWENAKSSLLAELDGLVRKRADAADVEGVRQLAQVFFHGFPAEDLKQSEAENLYGFIYSAFRMLQRWDNGSAQVRIFNPDLEHNGWESSHTAVVVLARDMPFLLDSTRGELNRRNANIHMLHGQNFGVERDESGSITGILTQREQRSLSLLFFEIDRRSEQPELQDLQRTLEEILAEVDCVVSDFPAMRARLAEVVALVQADRHVAPSTTQENCAFLQWMEGNNVTLLGYECLSVRYDGKAQAGVAVDEVADQRMGLLRLRSTSGRYDLQRDILEGMAQGQPANAQQLTFSKSRIRSRVHRFAYPDYIEINQYDESGRIQCQHRFMGLYTFAVYSESPSHIPLVRLKIQQIMAMSGLDMSNHEGRELARVLELFPRDELFHADVYQLFSTATAINQLQERRRTRLFIRHDIHNKFASCMVYMPRDRYTTEKRLAIQSLLCGTLGALESEFTTTFTESVLVRIYFVLLLDASKPVEYDPLELEAAVVELSQEWGDRLREKLLEDFGEERGAGLALRFEEAFPPGYRAQFEPRVAAADVARVLQLEQGRKLSMSLYRQLHQSDTRLHFRLCSRGESLPLSDVLPVLENLGLRVLAENPYEIRTSDGERFWIQDFDIQYSLGQVVDIHEVRDEFTDAFERIWFGEAESDGFNKLLLGTRLNWREVALLRAYAKYLKQVNFAFSTDYIAETLQQHLHITGSLVELFLSRFDPDAEGDTAWRESRQADIEARIVAALDDVQNLGQDRIIRQYVALIKATVRTNFFQRNRDGKRHGYFSFKFLPRLIPDIPRPLPAFEIFVYAPWVEGVHLRGGKVARGGLRWSDRQEDFRTEVLGLVKAQQVKNAVIVPVGAKGGFVAKDLDKMVGREARQAEGIRCYQTFIRALLDITDNVVDGRLTPPEGVLRMDDDDPYLVVAADKGTATFSDIANALSEEYGHWLGDAFASGGSVGYDHKKMGITARGAWVSVQRHFRELGLDCQRSEFTVVGIGDMAGDVFGNGMLLSEKIRLVAAFNHQHVFIDPNPDASASFAERQRLFQMDRSSWDDYDRSLISAGGGVFSRQAKAIAVSPEMRERFGLEAVSVTPTELIRACLTAQVDLLWNGGIGTYVKSAAETHADVGDKANDALRVNGAELRCRVVGEGGNLGLTQLGRIEYARAGGRCNTDFIDNAAGVDCSDHEVNIKILLNAVVSRGDMTPKQRNALLESMTATVAELVLDNNYQQTQAISVAERESARRLGEYGRLMSLLESSGRLDRGLEFLPDDEALQARRALGEGLTRPELAVLLSYSKAILKEQLTASDLHDNPHLALAVADAFPPRLSQEFAADLLQHSLRREIIATQIANDMINRCGVSFVGRLMTSTGATAPAVATAYVTARDIYQLPAQWAAIESHDHRISSELQIEMMIDLVRLLRRSSRWLLRNRRQSLEPAQVLQEFQQGVMELQAALPALLPERARTQVENRASTLVEQGVDAGLASYVAKTGALAMVLGIVEASRSTGATVLEVGELFFLLGETLELDWFAEQISSAKIDTEWQAQARDTYLEDLEWQQRSLAVGALQHLCEARDPRLCIERWMAQEDKLIKRWRHMLAELRSVETTDFAMFAVANRELLDLAQSSLNQNRAAKAPAADAG
ncbi:MAG: NAD-glutamate dehydrogenase [Halieaceae bacterium]|jgi:glutamate dehydrogenase|nr:NAD-glutamate dehydrogenase [Halieaceae bacterium]